VKFYHASNHEIEWPDKELHQRNLRSPANGNSALGLFANTNPDGLGRYGKFLYSFYLEFGFSVKSLPPSLMMPGRCVEYYRGIQDALTELGYDGAIEWSGNNATLAIFNFDKINNWKLSAESC